MGMTGVTIGLYMVINILGPLDASGGVLRKKSPTHGPNKLSYITIPRASYVALLWITLGDPLYKKETSSRRHIGGPGS